MFSILAGESTLGGQECSVNVVALTWNMGNSTAEHAVVADMVGQITAKGFPDVILVGTQEEMAEDRTQLNKQLLDELKSKGHEYRLQGKESHLTLAGANSSLKNAGQMAFQNMRALQNRTSLSVLVKTSSHLENMETRIDYPPGKKKSNNSFIVIKGDLKKGTCQLPMTIASVHLSSKTDEKRRSHANVFLEHNFKSPETYDALLDQAQRFNLIMGDFNERDYLMQDGTVSDRGFLTNFMAYGYDFSASQERPSFGYGTYGFTKVHQQPAKIKIPENLRDPRKRPHSAKGGYLDRITFTSGLPVESDTKEYGPLTDYKFYRQKENGKWRYSTSDHVPVVRFFKITVSENKASVGRTYVERLLPDFGPYMKQLEKLGAGTHFDDKHLEQLKVLRFHDDKDLTDKKTDKKLIEQFFYQLSYFGLNVHKPIDHLTKLQGDVDSLKSKLKSASPQFLLDAHNKIKTCNLERNTFLEAMDSKKAPVKVQAGDPDPEKGKWLIPATLPQLNYNCYYYALEHLLGEQK
jgi:endonuclease/exonuclease/phosphatase family metal-dependent hydrolase